MFVDGFETIYEWILNGRVDKKTSVYVRVSERVCVCECVYVHCVAFSSHRITYKTSEELWCLQSVVGYKYISDLNWYMIFLEFYF